MLSTIFIDLIAVLAILFAVLQLPIGSYTFGTLLFC